MEIMSPAGSIRRRVAIGVLSGLFALGTVVGVYAVVRWNRHEADFPGVFLVAWLAFAIGLRQMWVAIRKAESRKLEGLDEPVGRTLEKRMDNAPERIDR